MTASHLFAVAFGSALGGVTRALFGAYLPGISHSPFPLSTFLANFLGSWLLGLVCGLGLQHIEDGKPGGAYFFLGVGFCGGFTTLSTFEWELFQLVRAGRWVALGSYLLATIFLCFLGLFWGFRLGSFFGGGAS